MESKKKTAVVRWYVAKAQHSTLPYRERLSLAGLEYFLPTRFKMQNIAGKMLRVERPVIFNYLFIHATVFQIKTFCSMNAGLHLVYRHRHIDDNENTEDKMLLTVDDHEMRMFAQTIGQYTQDVPFIRPTEIDLEKGDHVRIIGGEFSGVEGVLMSQQGKDGGRVLVSISDLLAVPTLEIEPEYLQIISFAPIGKHMYKKFDSFMARARKAMRHFIEKKLEKGDIVALSTFEQRFSALQTHTINSEVKLLVYLLVCYTCLENKDKMTETADHLSELLPRINSETFKALALTYLFACTKQNDYLRQADEIVTLWGVIGEKEKSKREITEDLLLYREI